MFLYQLEIPKISNPNFTRSANLPAYIDMHTGKMINISQTDRFLFPPLILMETGHIMNINRAEIAARILTRQNDSQVQVADVLSWTDQLRFCLSW